MLDQSNVLFYFFFRLLESRSAILTALLTRSSPWQVFSSSPRCAFSSLYPVVLPMNKSLTNFRCLVMVLCAWSISVLLATGPITHWGRYEFTSNIFNCDYYHTTSKAEVSYNIALMLCGYLIPFGFMVFCYVNILRALQKTPLTHGSYVINIIGARGRRPCFLGNQVVYDHVNCVLGISSL